MTGMTKLKFGLAALLVGVTMATVAPELNAEAATGEKAAAPIPEKAAPACESEPVSFARRAKDLLKSLEHDVWGRGKQLWPWTGGATGGNPGTALAEVQWHLPLLGGRHIRLDAFETDKQFSVSAELPGFDRSEIHVGTHGGRLIITATHQEEKAEGEKTDELQWRERSIGSASRTILLPLNADADNVEASYKNGVLNIMIPKLPAGAKGSEPVGVFIL